MPLQATSGAASYDAFGGGVPVVPTYIEEVFSTWLYSSTGTSPSAIVNGIDLAGKGGLVIGKVRNYVDGMGWVDTVRGGSNYLQSDVTNEQFNTSAYSFNNNGYSLQSTNFLNFGTAGQFNFCSWTLRKQPKFFDIQTWTGTGSNRTISHSLGSVPACIIVKRTNTSADWQVYHRSLANTEYLVLNTTAAKATGATRWNSTTPTSSVFSLGTDASVNASGSTYVAYLFAHDAGGFGLTGTDNVISCGSYTGGGSTAVPVTLGYEPQWIMVRSSSAADNWTIIDNMRGWRTPYPVTSSNSQSLYANSSDAENDVYFGTTPTGFVANDTIYGGLNVSGRTYIYIAIRRGPMKVPTSGTSVFSPIARTGTGTTATVTGVGFPPDLFIGQIRGTAGYWNGAVDRLRGVTKRLVTSQTNAEDTTTDAVTSFTMDGSTLGIDSNGFVNESGKTYIEWNFRRAPSFFDEVCYTGNYYVGTDFQAVAHNLAVVPELAIIKRRSTVKAWNVYYGNVSQYMELQSTAAESSAGDRFDSTSPTATTFYVGADSDTNSGGITYVMYLFATCAGVSKVGSYTGTATTKQIDCGFTGGARFVLIKRTDSTGDWYVWDSARGIVSGNDPYLLLNSTAAEVTNTDYIDTYSAGFEISSTAPAAINASGGTFVFLAIA